MKRDTLIFVIYDRTKFQDHTLNSSNAAPSSEVRTTAMLVLLTVGN